MFKIKVLGQSGGKGNHISNSNFNLPCFKVNNSILLDAGAIFSEFNKNLLNLEHVFITHPHLDHIVDLPFYIDRFFALRNTPLFIWGLKETIETLKNHFFNNFIWPDFSQIRLLNSREPAIAYQELESEKEIKVNEFIIKPVKMNHVVPCAGYVVEKDEKAFLYTGDTISCDSLWRELNNNPKIKTLIVDVSFPSEMEELAFKSKHYTPILLKRDIENFLQRHIEIYIFHMKPEYRKTIKKEFENFPLKIKFLEEGMEIKIE